MKAQKIDVFFSAQSFEKSAVRGSIAVVIDVLRASSTMITALSNGAKGVVPVKSMGDASQMAAKIASTHYLLCGEKDGIKIEDFDLGNSPFEYATDVVKDKTIILTTTNGTVAIQQAQMAKEIYIAGFLNLKAVVEKLQQQHANDDIVLICSGWKGRMSLEDILCAGMMVYEFCQCKDQVELPDGAKVALALYHAYAENLADTLANSNHAKRLAEHLENDDIGYCSQVNTFNIAPKIVDGILVDGQT